MTLTGTHFDFGPLKFLYDRAGQIDICDWHATPTTITAIVYILSDDYGIVQISINTPQGTSQPLPFNTGAIASGSSGGCTTANGQSTCSKLHWEVDTNAATTTSDQSSARTVPDFLFRRPRRTLATDPPILPAPCSRPRSRASWLRSPE